MEERKGSGEESPVSPGKGKNVIIPVKKEVVESEILYKEQKSEHEYIIDWPAPSELLVFLVVKQQEEKAQETGFGILKLLQEKKTSIVVEDSWHDSWKDTPGIETKERIFKASEVDIKNVNVIVTLGGDGTILWAQRYFKYGSIPPIIAFNLGTHSYLTNFDAKQYEEVLVDGLCLVEKKSETGYKIEVKSRIACTLMPSSKDPNSSTKRKNFVSSSEAEVTIEEIQAINDITIDRVRKCNNSPQGQSQSLTNIECFINGKFLTTIQADGIIISTPSGSTAYNMAAGGSLMHCAITGLLFTPVCPFSLSFRPLVFPEDVQIRFKVAGDARATAFVSVDGHTRFELNREECLDVSMSKFPVSYMVGSSNSMVSTWCSKIKKLLNWNAKSKHKRSGSQLDLATKQ